MTGCAPAGGVADAAKVEGLSETFVALFADLRSTTSTAAGCEVPAAPLGRISRRPANVFLWLILEVMHGAENFSHRLCCRRSMSATLRCCVCCAGLFAAAARDQSEIYNFTIS